MATNKRHQLRFDFALSFAGPTRALARSLRDRLRDLGFSVFLDEDFEHEIIGEDASVYLRQVYANQSRVCVVLISREYDQRAWTNLERESIQSRELRGEHGVLVPVVTDDHRPSWLPSTRIYFDISKRGLDDLVGLLKRMREEKIQPRVTFEAAAEPLDEAVLKLFHSMPSDNRGRRFHIECWLQSRPQELGRLEAKELNFNSPAKGAIAVNLMVPTSVWGYQHKDPYEYLHWALRSDDRQLRLICSRNAVEDLLKRMIDPNQCRFTPATMIDANFLGRISRTRDSGVHQGLYFTYRAIASGSELNA